MSINFKSTANDFIPQMKDVFYPSKQKKIMNVSVIILYVLLFIMLVNPILYLLGLLNKEVRGKNNWFCWTFKVAVSQISVMILFFLISVSLFATHNHSKWWKIIIPVYPIYTQDKEGDFVSKYISGYSSLRP